MQPVVARTPSPAAFDCASSFSWCGKTRSSPPPWMSNCAPRYFVAIAEHSRCQPGRPRPHGRRPGRLAGLGRTSTARSRAGRACARRRRCRRRPACRRSSGRDSAPYAGNDCTSKYTSPSTAYAWSLSMSRCISSTISGRARSRAVRRSAARSRAPASASPTARSPRNASAHHGSSFSRGLDEDLVVDVGDIADESGRDAVVLQPVAQDVEGDPVADVADVRRPLDGEPAQVDRRRARVRAARTAAPPGSRCRTGAGSPAHRRERGRCGGQRRSLPSIGCTYVPNRSSSSSGRPHGRRALRCRRRSSSPPRTATTPTTTTTRGTTSPTRSRAFETALGALEGGTAWRSRSGMAAIAAVADSRPQRDRRRRPGRRVLGRDHDVPDDGRDGTDDRPLRGHRRHRRGRRRPRRRGPALGRGGEQPDDGRGGPARAHRGGARARGARRRGRDVLDAAEPAPARTRRGRRRCTRSPSTSPGTRTCSWARCRCARRTLLAAAARPAHHRRSRAGRAGVVPRDPRLRTLALRMERAQANAAELAPTALGASRA